MKGKLKGKRKRKGKLRKVKDGICLTKAGGVVAYEDWVYDDGEEAIVIHVNTIVL